MRRSCSRGAVRIREKDFPENTDKDRESLQRDNAVDGRAHVEKLPVTQNPELSKQSELPALPKLPGTTETVRSTDAKSREGDIEPMQK